LFHFHWYQMGKALGNGARREMWIDIDQSRTVG
jgi:hypothetical protein